ncbi:unnamed protein product [Moneuplotes crassus]|uniref:Uncharacterized protein n=1 Tax=Euplotes crassus TaxID=5936 RepID=A0AAD1XW09_EUPCR|nr:unnamed protein product [Moneuplotes crassus]
MLIVIALIFGEAVAKSRGGSSSRRRSSSSSGGSGGSGGSCNGSTFTCVGIPLIIIGSLCFLVCGGIGIFCLCRKLREIRSNSNKKQLAQLARPNVDPFEEKQLENKLDILHQENDKKVKDSLFAPQTHYPAHMVPKYPIPGQYIPKIDQPPVKNENNLADEVKDEDADLSLGTIHSRSDSEVSNKEVEAPQNVIVKSLQVAYSNTTPIAPVHPNSINLQIPSPAANISHSSEHIV